MPTDQKEPAAEPIGCQKKRSVFEMSYEMAFVGTDGCQKQVRKKRKSEKLKGRMAVLRRLRTSREPLIQNEDPDIERVHTGLETNSDSEAIVTWELPGWQLPPRNFPNAARQRQRHAVAAMTLHAALHGKDDTAGVDAIAGKDAPAGDFLEQIMKAESIDRDHEARKALRAEIEAEAKWPNLTAAEAKQSSEIFLREHYQKLI